MHQNKNPLFLIAIRFLSQIHRSQARFSIGGGMYEATAKTELISLGYARAKATELLNGHIIHGVFMYKTRYLSLMVVFNRAK